MMRWVVRAGVIRFVGRKAIPVLMVYDAVQLVRAVRRRTRRTEQMPDPKRRGRPADPVRDRVDPRVDEQG